MIKTQKTSPHAGFTLIELLIAVIVTGIILGLISTAVVSFSQQISDRKNKRILTTVQDQINKYLEVNGRYPCPARLTLDISDAEFGLEAFPSCTSGGTGNGIFRTSGRGGRNIKIGAVPVRSLNLPDEYIFDTYNTRLLYAVTERMATDGTYNRDEGAISIQDGNGNSIVQPAGSAPYIILTHGENKSGGYAGTTGVSSGVNCSGLSPSEQENCDNDSVFIRTLLKSTDGNTYFDDELLTRSGNGLSQEVPSGGIVYFSLQQCPRGWQDFFGASPPDGTVACIKI